MQLEIGKGAMTLMADGEANGAIEGIGITPTQFKTVTGSTPWVGKDREQVVRILNAMIGGTIDVIGLLRFEVPAEYVAACIAMFVHPGNVMVACRWMEGGSENQELARDGEAGGTEKCTASQLFALVLMMREDGECVTHAQGQFEKRTKLAFEKAEKGKKAKK